MREDDSRAGAGGYMSASEVAHELGISLPTLYAYVSRGLLRSEFADAAKRTRRYRVEDVKRLKDRQEMRRDPQKVVDKALHWGTPVLASALTSIEAGRFYYRGQDVQTLARDNSAEQVAALLWTGEANQADLLFAPPLPPLPPHLQAFWSALHAAAPIGRCQALLPLLGAEDLAAYDFRPESTALAGARILRRMALLATGSRHGTERTENIVTVLHRALAPHNPETMPLFSAALILCADHELNVSSFTARCVASAGSSPYAVVSGGLAALQGVKHGGVSARVEALFEETERPEDARRTLAQRLQRGENVPGFGHPLYPDGDPRGRLLLELVRGAYPQSPGVELADSLLEAANAAAFAPPTIDFALATLCRALELPTGTGLMLFALGRTIGWIGHAIEEYQADRLIRPRAHYTGVLPAATEGEQEV